MDNINALYPQSNLFGSTAKPPRELSLNSCTLIPWEIVDLIGSYFQEASDPYSCVHELMLLGSTNKHYYYFSRHQVVKIIQNFPEIPLHGFLPSAPVADLVQFLVAFKVEYINLSSTQVTNQDIQRLTTHIPNLKFLDIGYCNHLRDRYLSIHLSALTNLEYLDVTDGMLNDLDIFALTTNLPNLKYLRLKKNHVIGNDSLCFISLYLPELRELDISWTQVGDEGCLSIATSLKNLTYLNLTWTMVEDSTVCTLVRELSLLETLSLSWCFNPTDRSAKEIAENLPNLTSLNMSWCQLTDEGVEHLCGRLKKLNMLMLSGNLISNAGATKIANSLPLLEVLKLRNCTGVGNQGALQLASRLFHIRLLDLQKTNVNPITKVIVKHMLPLAQIKF